ncbi:hypothetical protein E3N88_33632 [Mikania micrantha]|uniref:Uncharacterized protein n=1 Tax=Mikania micrantha TaxID=192012 RepID=A0A5N6MD58_9ASTR|nr:hypothetical protein E3N88_33632 [Mikania micrantha]
MHSSSELSQNPLKIKEDDKFFSKLLSKENSVANPSFRVYYGNVSGTVPFTWEIQPGTPKYKYSDNPLIPPLTPPPSYYIDHHQNKPITNTKYHPRSKILYNLLLNINVIKKQHVAPSSPSSPSSSSWSSSLSSSVASSSSSRGSRSRRRRFSSFGSSFDDGPMFGGGSPDSVMCFGMNNNKGGGGGGVGGGGDGGGSYTVVFMKKAFLSIVGCNRSG